LAIRMVNFSFPHTILPDR